MDHVACQLKLPQELSEVHNVFHVSDFRRHLSNKTLVTPPGEIEVVGKLHVVKEPLEVIDRQVENLSWNRIELIKVS